MRAQEHIQQSQFQPLVGVDPLQTTWLERGAVRSRVALLLRSSETQPLFNDLSSIDRTCPQASDQSPVAICSRGCLSCFHRWPRAASLHHCSRAVALHADSRSPPEHLYGCLFSSSIGSSCILDHTRPTPSTCSVICSRLTGPLHRPPINPEAVLAASTGCVPRAAVSHHCSRAVALSRRDSRSPPGASIRLPVLVLDWQHLHPRPHKAHAIDLFSDLFSIDRTASQASNQSRGCTGSPFWCLLLRWK